MAKKGGAASMHRATQSNIEGKSADYRQAPYNVLPSAKYEPLGQARESPGMLPNAKKMAFRAKKIA